MNIAPPINDAGYATAKTLLRYFQRPCESIRAQHSLILGTEPSGQKPLSLVYKQDFHPNVHLCLGLYQQETPGTEKNLLEQEQMCHNALKLPNGS